MEITKNNSWGKNFGLFLLLTCVLAFFSGCAPVFSDLQSARLVGQGKVELTPDFSSVGIHSEGESQHIQNQYGVQAGIGILKWADFRLRYERIEVEDVDFGTNVFGFGPKIRLYKDYAAFYAPVGFAFGGDVETSESWEVHPTLLVTLPLGKYFEINPSAKMLIPFNSDRDTYVAFNLGAALSSDVTKWAIRPEMGICFKPGEEGYFWQFSVGLSVSSGLFSKPTS